MVYSLYIVPQFNFETRKLLSGARKPMAKKSLERAMILLVGLIIFAIFKVEANVLTPPSLSSPLLPIRLLRSYQPRPHTTKTLAVIPQARIKQRCSERSFFLCQFGTRPKALARCVRRQYTRCLVDLIHIKDLKDRINRASKTCERICVSRLTVVEHKHATCLLLCLDVSLGLLTS